MPTKPVAPVNRTARSGTASWALEVTERGLLWAAGAGISRLTTGGRARNDSGAKADIARAARRYRVVTLDGTGPGAPQPGVRGSSADWSRRRSRAPRSAGDRRST